MKTARWLYRHGFKPSDCFGVEDKTYEAWGFYAEHTLNGVGWSVGRYFDLGWLIIIEPAVQFSRHPSIGLARMMGNVPSREIKEYLRLNRERWHIRCHNAMRIEF